MIAAALDVKIGPWRIWFDPPPIPVRNCDWHYQHEDADEECPSWMNGDGPSFEACLTDIIEGYEDRLAPETPRVATTHCAMPSTCETVGSCLYPASACLTGPSASNDAAALSPRELVKAGEG